MPGKSKHDWYTIRRNRGQVTVEYILLAVVLIVLFQLAANTLRDNGYLKNFQDAPNKIFVNLIENGNGAGWAKSVSAPESRNYHPNHHKLHFTSDGKE